MSETNTESPEQPEGGVQLEGGTYEIIRKRLLAHGEDLRERVEQLDRARKAVFGAIETELKSTERVTTEHNCTPRDMVPVGARFLFGYNVQMGLKSVTAVDDVLSVYAYRDGQFIEESTDTLLQDDAFELDFRNLFKYYRESRFAKFAVRGPHLYMVFRVGKAITDLKAFKWLITPEGTLQYLDNRSDHEYTFPEQHDFDWKRAHRDLHRSGMHPHISIEDRVFVEAVGGDLTIKVEDNTESGEGIYAEPVDNPDQTLDDAEVLYALIGHLVVLKIRPYQENDFRYFIFNGKTQTVERIDAIGHTCILLPEDQGLIFANGYYLQDGRMKVFAHDPDAMLFEHRSDAANGEDFLYEFYHRASGEYILLSYNMIRQEVETPVICNGFSIFENGELLLFKAEEEAQKHHGIQVWQTPFVGPNYVPPVQSESPLYKLGNKPIVRCMSECHEIINLLYKEEGYANLYAEITKRASEVIDSYFWLSNEETHRLDEPLGEIREAAAAAIAEFDKVVRLRSNARSEVKRVSGEVQDIIRGIDYHVLKEIGQYVHLLAGLRRVRGEVISLREVRYANLEQVDALEAEVAKHTEDLSQHCVEFLLREDSLDPYQAQVDAAGERIEGLKKVAEAKKAGEDISACAEELEMLIEIVSNLKIEDATQTTAIIDGISGIYAQVNQLKAALKNRQQELMKVEGAAGFAAQLKLLNQSVVNYLEVCDSPERCDEYANKVMVQVEDLESRFSEFDDYIVELAEKREELYSAFESRKVQLVEARSKRASALAASADRILKGVSNRAENLESTSEINGYFASDIMIDKVRNIVTELGALGDSVKADEVQTRLKTIQEDAVRQLKDRQELYEDGENIIAIGAHKFTVNHQPLELTTVFRGGDLYVHLNGTGFFERVEDPSLEACRPVWEQELVSENPQVYRAEYLAWQLYCRQAAGDGAWRKEWLALEEEALLQRVQEFSSPRYAEGYNKGVHDQDGAAIFRTLLELEEQLGLLRFSGPARALGLYFWHVLADEEARRIIETRIQAHARLTALYPAARIPAEPLAALETRLQAFAETLPVFDALHCREAARYLFEELGDPGRNVLSQRASDLFRHFEELLRRKKLDRELAELVDRVRSEPAEAYGILRGWLHSFMEETGRPGDLPEYLDETAALFLIGDLAERHVVDIEPARPIKDMKGIHALIDKGVYRFHFIHFIDRLTRYSAETAPLFEQFTETKKRVLEDYSEALKLDEFKPRILSSFVRNRLLNEVYLPLIGDNLAKQTGTAGDQTRTDRMGLLLLISPPGYGKTTLMEYIANRLGLTFVKVNGPALGHDVTSLDPEEAGHASAREEIKKLNLAFEMGDNVMIYLDDIQHCNPELLQKFISLCDAQRKIEGVYKGRSRTYDLRGKKVAVVMAGNPYTESGDKFQIPDMLANRSDTYNLGDIIGDSGDSFKLSYLENALTSNPVLNKLAREDAKDIYALIRAAELGEREGLELIGNYSAEELNEYLDTLAKLLKVRDVILKVNQEYIHSAGQEEAYRTEPSFKLQGSYRNMNRIAERVLPVMNERELETLIASSYEQDAQVLTTGAESNLLKFRELLGWLDEEQAARWADIKKKFQRNLAFAGIESGDRMGKLMGQLTTFTDGLDGIRSVLESGVAKIGQGGEEEQELPELVSPEVLERIEAVVRELGEPREREALQTEVSARLPEALAQVFEQQNRRLSEWMEPVLSKSQLSFETMQNLVGNFNEMVDGYNVVLEQLRDHYLPVLKKDEQKKLGDKKD